MLDLLLILFFLCLLGLFLCFLLSLFRLCQEPGSFEDEEFTTVANIHELDLVTAEAFLGTLELDGALELTLQVEDEIAARIVHHYVLLADERLKVAIVHSTLWEKIDVAEVAEWLHDDTEAFEDTV